MSTLTNPNAIANAQPLDATKVQQNFAAIESYVNSNVVTKDGATAMTGALTLAAAPTEDLHAASKLYVDLSIPAGVKFEYAGATLPAGGYAWCDGSVVDGTSPTYARLFAAIGNTYGGGGAATMTLPDDRGRVSVGKAAAGTFATLGAVGGAETHALSIAELASHGHTASSSSSSSSSSVVSDPGHGHGLHRNALSGSATGAEQILQTSANSGSFYTSTQSDVTSITVSTSTSTSTSTTVNNNGSGTAHNNLQPYRVCNKIIKL